MGDYDNIELQGTEREKALRAIHDQIKKWGLTMPNVEAIPLHFGLDRFLEVGETEFWIANEREHGYCGKFLFLFDGQTCPYHHHEKKHETFFVLKGRIRMRIGSEETVMREGDRLAMPAGKGHSFTGIGPALVLEVSTPTLLQDNFFSDSHIGENGVI